MKLSSKYILKMKNMLISIKISGDTKNIILVDYYQEVIYKNAYNVSLKIHECYVLCDTWNIKTFSF